VAETGHDRGQAAVEFAIALPLVVVLVLGLAQVIVVARDQIAVELAAREGARAAAVAAHPGPAASDAASRATTLRPLSVGAHLHGDRVTVDVRYVSDTRVPLIGALVSGVELTASVTMAREPP
jgi:uncharacterized protein (UPF0333 family)